MNTVKTRALESTLRIVYECHLCTYTHTYIKSLKMFTYNCTMVVAEAFPFYYNIFFVKEIKLWFLQKVSFLQLNRFREATVTIYKKNCKYEFVKITSSITIDFYVRVHLHCFNCLPINTYNIHIAHEELIVYIIQ
jgi:hypothetical protein